MQAPTTLVPPNAWAPTESLKILMIEDDELVARTISRTLTARGYVVEHAASGPEGLMFALRTAYDVVLLDLNLPQMHGLELLQVLRTHDNQTPVVLMTADPTLETAQLALERGGTRYVIKPVDPRKLLETVEAARAERASRSSTPPPRVSVDEFREILSGLRVVMQPIVKADGAQLLGYEALCRTDHAKRLSALDVVDAAETLHLTQDFGRTVRRCVSEIARNVPDDALLFVNVLPRDLFDEVLLSDAESLRPYTGRVVFELAERASVHMVPGATARIRELRGLGYRFALDDLGAGSAGIRTIAEVEPAFIKIDMSLVRNIHRDRAQLRLVKALVDVGHEANAKIIAEGIEVAEEFAAVRELECDYFQGYLFGRPQPFGV